MEYKLTKITPWKDRYYFEIKTFDYVDNEFRKIETERISTKKSSFPRNIEELAKEKERIEKSIKNGTYGKQDTLGVLYDDWKKHLEQIQHGPEPETIKNYEYDAEQLWTIKIDNKSIKDRLLKDFNKKITSSIGKEMNKHLTPRYNRECFKLLGRLFKYAAEEERGIIFNYCDQVDRNEFKRIFKKNEDSKEDPIIVQGGYKKALQKLGKLCDVFKIRNYDAYVLIRLMRELGGRFGEIIPLLLKDFIIEDGIGYLDINKTVNTSSGRLKHKPKSRAGDRAVTLSKEMTQLLCEYIEKKNITDPNQLLFTTEKGTMLHRNNFVNRVLNKYNKEIGIVGNITPHSFRVFVITLKEYLEENKQAMMRDHGHATKEISDRYVKGGWRNFEKEQERADKIAALMKN
tara:strand:+ start:775 stop:1980 length:1206 start_codon:yes stop_codon:yes gene_type:complete